MARPLPADYLQKDERLVFQSDRRFISVIDELIALIVAIELLTAGILVFFTIIQPTLWTPLGVPLLVATGILGGMLFISRIWHTQTSLYTLTDQRMYKAHGRIRFFLLQTTFDKVTDLHLKQGIFGRMFGYGTIRLETAGAGLVLAGVPDPYGFKQEIERARTTFLHTLVGEQKPTQATSTARQPGMGRTQWSGSPASVSIIGRTTFGAVALMFGVGAVISGILFAPPMLIFGLGALIFGGVALATAIIHLKFTKYHVLDGGVVVTGGWLSRYRVEATYSKITDVHTSQTILGRLFGYGELRINTAGSNAAPITFAGVEEPEQLKSHIDRARGDSDD